MKMTFHTRFLIVIIICFLVILSGCNKETEQKSTEMGTPQIMEQNEIGKEFSQFEIGGMLHRWYNKGITGKGVKIAILDTGVDKNCNDLSIVAGTNFISDDSSDYQDDNGHGTKIAGIIGARKNGLNLIGIAPDSDLYIAKVADKNGHVKFKNLVKGINWAIEQNVDIINISLEFENDDNTLHDVIKTATNHNILIIASCGNIRFEGDTYSAYPGKYPEVISVGMLNDYRQIYSKEFLSKKVDVYAPGVDIAALYFDNKMTLDTGVSFATAYATGYSGLIVQSNKENNKPITRDLLVAQLNNDLGARSSFGLFHITLLIFLLSVLGWVIYALVYSIRNNKKVPMRKFPYKPLIISMSIIVICNLVVFIWTKLL